MLSTKTRIVGIAAILVAAGSASAQVPWSNANGSGTFFTWSNGRNSNTNLFGSPTVVGDTFYFFPANFVANSENGTPAQAVDTFEVDLYVNAGFKFDAIQIAEFGDYALTNTLGNPTPSSVSAASLLEINEIGGIGRSTSENLTFPGLPLSTAAATSGTWQGSGVSNLTSLETGGPFTQIHLKVTNTLIAISGGQGQSALIRKTVVGDTVAVTIVPAPGAAALLGLGGLLAARRRRNA